MTQPNDPLTFVFFNEVAIVEQLARTRFERLLPDKLKLPHFAVLNHLVRLGDGRTPLQIARAFEITKAAMTNTLGRLETRKFVRIEPDPDDGRSKRVFLTERGKAAREKCVTELTAAMKDFSVAVPDDVLTIALPGIRAARRWLDENRLA